VNFLGTTDAQPLVIRTNNTEQIRVTANGRVGIGTPTPGAKLDVHGGNGTCIRVSGAMPAGDGSHGLISYELANSSAGGYWKLYLADPDGGYGVAPRSFEIWEYPANLGSGGCCRPRLRILSSDGLANPAEVVIDAVGNVGIGRLAPVARLDILQSSTGDLSRIVRIGAGGSTLWSLGITDAAGTYFRIASEDLINDPPFVIHKISGNVGIGTTTPVEKLTVEPYHSFSTANITPSSIIPFGTSKIGLSSDRGIYLIDDTDFIGLALKNEGADRKDAVIYWGDNLGSDNLRFMFAEWGGGTITLRDRMIITSTGNVGIGTTSPAYRLHVAGHIYATGDVYCYGWSICSDQRWKTNIKPIQNALDNVLKMQGVTYYWKVDEYPDKHFPEGEQIGFIAQEIEKVYPQVVHTDKDGYKSVDYSKLTPILVEAIKEQQKIIEELQKVIQQLQEENSQIKQANAQLSAEIKMLNEKVDNLINSLSNDKKLGYR
jgi:hypothetical protein